MSESYDRGPDEAATINDFLEEFFRPEYVQDSDTISSHEREEIEEILESASELYDIGVAYYGLYLTFCLLLEDLSHSDERLNKYEPGFDLDDLLQRYKLKDADTLTIYYKGEEYGIRDIHEHSVEPLFNNGLGRTNFPSSAPYTTGKWRRYDEKLIRTFRLSRPGRYETVNKLLDFGLRELTRRDFDAREDELPRTFTEILQRYPRKDPDEEAGSAYQAMAYGFVKAEWPHLSLRTSKLRTGSSRQNRLGDIDGYIGPDLMVSVEAKDKKVSDSVVRDELTGLRQLGQDTGALAIVMCKSITDNARTTLTADNVSVLTDSEIIEHLRLWDYHKQNNAVQGMIHYFKNVEENPDATQRILEFLNEVEPENLAVDTIDSSMTSVD